MYIHLKSIDETSYKITFTMMVSFQRTRKFSMVFVGFFNVCSDSTSRFKTLKFKM